MRKMIAGLFVILTFLPLSSAFGDDARVLLEYRYGNQITSSEVTVLTDGLVIQRNRLQASYVYLPNIKLSKSEVDSLIKAVDAAALAAQTYTEGEPTAFGSSSGELSGFTTNGKATLLFAASLKDSYEKISLVYQDGADGKTLRAFIQNLVSDKMPLGIIGE